MSSSDSSQVPIPIPVTIAIIGGGLIGPRHAQSIIRSPRTTLTALVDPAPYGPTTAASLGCAHYNTVDDLLSSPHRPEAAIICTPNSTHVALAIQLSSAGLHILIEKPISTDIPSGLSLLTHIRNLSPPIKFLTGHHRRFNPYITATKALLPSLGPILALSGLWTLLKPSAYFAPPQDWRRDTSAGAILINLVHEIDALQFLFGRITRVHAEAQQSTRGFAAPEGGAIILRFEPGVVGAFVLSDATPSPFSFEAGTGENVNIPHSGKDFYRIFGAKGSLSVGDMLRYSNGGWEEEVRVEDVGDLVERERIPFDAQMEHFAKLVRGEVDIPMCSGEEGLSALIVCEGVRRAMESGEGVSIKALWEEFGAGEMWESWSL